MDRKPQYIVFERFKRGHWKKWEEVFVVNSLLVSFFFVSLYPPKLNNGGDSDTLD